MKILKLVIPAAAALLVLGSASFAQESKKPVNTSVGAGAPMNFPTPMPNENGDYTQGGKPTASDAAAAKPKKTKMTKHKKKASSSS